MKSLLALSFAFASLTAQAQESSDLKLAAAAPVDPSAFVIDKTAAMGRCEQPALVKCLEMDEASCKSAMGEAADEANTAMAAEVARQKPTTATMEGYIQGVGAGRLIGAMVKKTNGKFYGCVMKR
jgi:hypothetical protein